MGWLNDVLRAIIGWLVLMALSDCSRLAMRGGAFASALLLVVWLWIAWVLGGAMVAPLLDLTGR